MPQILFALLVLQWCPMIAGAADDIMTTMQKLGDFTLFLKSIKFSGLTETLDHGGSYTVFAPTDTAFAQMPPETVDALFLPQNKQKLSSIVQAHILKGKLMATEIKTTTAITLGKAPMNVTRQGAAITFGGATVIKPDILANNGVVHAIDKVSLPEQENSVLPTPAPAKKPKRGTGRNANVEVPMPSYG
jgi:uncharacterized surface protein with fasciclin (FAS1) repeats